MNRSFSKYIGMVGWNNATFSKILNDIFFSEKAGLGIQKLLMDSE